MPSSPHLLPLYGPLYVSSKYQTGQREYNNGRTDLRPVTGLPLWTQEIIAGLGGQLVPLTAFALITAGLGCLSTHCPSTAGAPTTALGALQDKCLNINKCKHIYTAPDKPWQTSGLCSHTNTTILPLTKASTPSHRGYSLHGSLPYHQVCADHYSSDHQSSGSCHLHGWFWHNIFPGYDIQGRTGPCTHSYEPHATCIKGERANPCQYFPSNDQVKKELTGSFS